MNKLITLLIAVSIAGCGLTPEAPETPLIDVSAIIAAILAQILATFA